MKLTIYIAFQFVLSSLLCVNIFSQTASCTFCTNPGFESGTSSWNYFTGTACQNNTSEPCDVVSGFNAAQHALQNSGAYDPIVGGTILPVVPPGGGTKALRIGDGNVSGAKASRATIYYNVTQATANFAYQYAVVLQEPQGGGNPHLDAQRPYFSIRVYDENGNSISCGELFVLAKPPYVGFTQTKSGSNIWYRNWTKAIIDLSGFIGKCVRIEFTATDCTLTDHYGYAYVDASCNPLDLITTSSNECGGYTLTGPANARDYTWTNTTVGGTTGIDGANNTRTININRSGTYQVVMSSALGPNCSTKLSIAIDTVFSNPTNFTPNTGCSSITTQFKDISTPGGTISSWAWDFNNDGVTDKTIKNPSYNFPAAGNYPVTLNIKVGSCTASITKDVSVNIPSLPNVQPAGPYCLASSPITLVTDIPGGTWTGNGITNASVGNFDPSLAKPGDNQIVYTTPASCPGRDTILIHINAPISISGSNLNLCSGNTGKLGGASTAGYSYNWTPATGLSSTSVSNPTVTLINNGTSAQSLVYFVTTKVDSTGCYSSDSVKVTVNSKPLVNAGIDQSICSGSSVSLAGTVAGSATSYTWSGGAGTYNPNNTTLTSAYTPSAAEIVSGITSLTLTTNDPAGTCPQVSDQMSIYINKTPTVGVGPDQTICAGNTINLTATLGGTATSGSWSGASGTYNPNNTNTNVVYTTDPTEESNGYVTMAFTSNDPPGACNAATDQVKIYINPKPLANAGLDKALCNGSAVVLTGSVTGNGTTASWSGGAGTFSPDNKNLTASYTPTAAELAAGSFILTLSTDPSPPCPSSSDAVKITVNQTATVNAGIDQLICIDSMVSTANTITLAATYGGAATSGLWTGGAGTFNPNNTVANATYSLNESEINKASLNLIFTTNDPAGPCPSVNDQMSIIINQIPKVDAGTDQTVCEGTTIALSGVVSGTATSLTWTGGSGTFNPNNKSIHSIYTPTVAEAATGNVLLTVTTNDPVGPCPSASDQMQLTINPSASVNAGLDQVVCFGNMVSLAASMGGSASSGIWSGGNGTFNPDNTNPNSIYTPSVNEKNTGSVTLTYTSNDPIGPCDARSDQTIITINQLPTVSPGTVQPVCSGFSVPLAGAIGGSAKNGIWSGGNGKYAPNNTTLNAIYTPTQAEYNTGAVLLTLTSNDPTGPCVAASGKLKLTFNQPPVVDFNVNSSSGCAVHCTGFIDKSTVVGGGNIIGWNWDFGDGGTSNIKTPQHCYHQSGDFGITLRVTDDKGCSATFVRDSSIIVFEKPNAAFIATPNPVSQIDPTVNFQNQSSKDVNYWYWDFGDGKTFSPDQPNPSHTYPNQLDGTYQPVLIVRNANLCYDTASSGNTIHVGPQFSFFIPTAFTPDNKDGVNDYFYGQGTGIDIYDLWIYDRWGNIVFHSKDLNEKWDGRALEMTEFFGYNRGKEQAQRDVFVWRVILTDVFGNLHTYNGTVTLVR
jgi:PKD repeat protein